MILFHIKIIGKNYKAYGFITESQLNEYKNKNDFFILSAQKPSLRRYIKYDTISTITTFPVVGLKKYLHIWDNQPDLQ